MRYVESQEIKKTLVHMVLEIQAMPLDEPKVLHHGRTFEGQTALFQVRADTEELATRELLIQASNEFNERVINEQATVLGIHRAKLLKGIDDPKAFALVVGYVLIGPDSRSGIR